MASISEARLDVTLEGGRSVEVELVRPDGTPFLDPATISVDSTVPRERSAEVAGPGRYRLDDLPAGEVLLWIRCADHAVHRVHDTASPFARVVIGDVGRIVVTVKGAGAVESPPWQVAAAAPGSARDLARAPLHRREQDVHQTALSDLPLGRYDVWLEQPSPEDPDVWVRVGRATSVTLDAERAGVSLEWSVPR